ncbi:MAG: HypC/HybG/HupF family hydrogenase formation chaperone [Actinomycetota bacterium]
MCLGDIAAVTAVWEENGLPMVRVDGRADAACAIYAPEVVAGDLVHIHLGFVTEILDAERAADAMALRATVADAGEPISKEDTA